MSVLKILFLAAIVLLAVGLVGAFIVELIDIQRKRKP